MDTSVINPYLRSAAFFHWNFHDLYKNISYHRRIFAFRKNPAQIHIREQVWKIPADSLLLLSPGIPYQFQNTDPNHPFMLYCCQFDLTQEFRHTKPYCKPVKEIHFQPDQIVDVADPPSVLNDIVLLPSCPSLCEQILKIYEIQEENAPFAEEIMSGILKAVLFQVLQMHHTQNTDCISHSAMVVRNTMQYIREHCTDRITEKDIAAAMNFHPYYLTRLFRQHYETTPYRYLMQCRMDHAVRLLQNTDMSINEIAQRCGFSTQSHFAAFIQRKEEMSPSLLRKKLREGDFVI